jgi:hypothetical protein
MTLFIAKNNRLFLLSGIFLLGFCLKVAMSQLGSNFDFEMWKLNLAFFQKGESFYNYGRYNYSPFWVFLLNIIDYINISNFENPNIFRYKIIFILNFFDFLIFYLIFRNYSLKVGLIFFLSPISIFISGYHNAFDNIAIFFGFFSILLIEKRKKVEIKYLGLFFLGISLCAKHVLFILPIWLAFKEKNYINKFTYIAIPYFIFIISFLPYSGDYKSIIENVFLFSSYNNGPFWGLFAPQVLHMYLPKTAMFIFVMISAGFYFLKCNVRNTFFYYLICVVIFSPRIFNQYLAIPLLALAVLWNSKYFYYTLACISLYILDGDALGLGTKIFSNFFEWNIRSTRIFYYPIILLLFLGLLDSVFGKKEMYSHYKSFYNFFIINIKKQIKFKK